MKTNYILISVLITLILASPVSATWWDNDYAYKIPVEINNTKGLTIADYQINISIPFGINASSIRVVNETSATTVYHWCENVTSGDCYKLWFNATHIPAEAWCNDTYSIYYGNDAVASTSDYDNTFTKTYNTTGLVLELHMDEGAGNSVAVDSSGKGNNGTLTNMNVTGNTTSGWQGSDGGQWDNRSDAVFSTGDHLCFDGTNDNIGCGNNPSLDCTNALTISAIIHHTGGAYSQRIIAKENTYALRLTAADMVDVLIKSGGTIYFFTAPLSSLSTGQNVIVTSTFEAGDGVKIYENGNALTVTDVTGYTTGSIDISDKSVTIGSYTGTSQYFNGSLDEIRIYNRSLSENEIYRQYIRCKYAPQTPTISPITTETIISKTLPSEPDVKAVQTLINMCSGIKLQLTLLFDNAVNILPLVIAIVFMGIFSILIGKIFSTGLRIKR